MSATSHNFFGCCLRHCGLKHQRLSWGQDNKNGAHVCISCSAVSQKEHEIFLKSFRIDRKIFLERSSMFDGVKWAVNLSERRSWPSLYLFHIWSAFLCVFLKKSSFFFPLYSQNLFIVFEWPRISFCVCVTENDRNINCGSGRKHKQQLLFFSNMHAKFPVVLSSSCGMHTFVKTHSLSLKSILAALKWSFMSYLSACLYVIDLGSRRKS